MKNIIDTITNSIKKYHNNFTHGLEDSEIFWSKNYPLAIIHSLKRAKDQSIKTSLKPFANEQDTTKEEYKKEELDYIFQHQKAAINSAKYAILKSNLENNLIFKSKYPNDYWKKIKSVTHIISTFDYIIFSEDETQEIVEFKLREIIRKRKEIHALKDVGFIWMAVSQHDVNNIFKHYFDTNYICVENQYYIGWSERLKDINMRYFVYPPKQKK